MSNDGVDEVQNELSHDIESVRDDLAWEIDDVRDDVSSLETDVNRLKEDFNIWNLFERKMTPYVYDKSFEKIIVNLNNNSAYKSRINLFKNKANITKTDMYLPLKQKQLDNTEFRKTTIISGTTFLKNSKEFYLASIHASIDTQPIFCYYSTMYLFSFLLNSFIRFDNPKKHHGLYLTNTENIDEITFKYAPNGFFQRIVNTLSILQYPSAFGKFVPVTDSSNRPVLKENQTSLSLRNENDILLRTLVDHDFQIDLENNNIHYSQSRYKRTSTILRDFIILFIACSIARYYPVLWKRIYTGDESDLILSIKKSIVNINDIIRLVNDIFVEAEKGRFPDTLHENSLFNF